MSPDVQVVRLKEGLRAFLKRRGKTYPDVAEQLGVSVPTVKRILNKEELSLSRIVSLCDWLDIDLATLESWVQKEHTEEGQFTEEQELFLSSDPRYLAFFYQMYDHSVEEIAKTHGLNQASVDRYLLRLEQHGLVTVNTAGVARPSFREQPRWIERGPLVRQNYEVIVDWMFGFFRRRGMSGLHGGVEDKESQIRLTIDHDGFTEETFAGLQKEWFAAYRKYSEIAKTERKLRPEKKSYFVFTGFAKLPQKDPDAEAMNDIFGKITNL